MTQTFFTLQLEAGSSPIKAIIKDGLRIAKLMSIEVQTTINGIEILIHPLQDFDEIYENYLEEYKNPVSNEYNT